MKAHGTCPFRESSGSPIPRFRRKAGAALILALAALVLILVIVLAFFSRATLQRQISSSSASNTQVDFLAETSLNIILDDIRHEIEAGSMPDPLTNVNIRIFRPLITTNGIFAPSMSLQRVGDAGITNIVKISRSNAPFFTSSDGYAKPAGRPKDGIARASAISADAPSANGRRISAVRWNHPKFMTAAEVAQFKAPDWIYLDRAGKNPTNFTDLGKLANASPDNKDFVLGRFAYVIYDEGGLLDINVIGNALPAAENTRKGRAHQITLTNGLAGITVPQFSTFISWRSPTTATQGGREADQLFDPGRDFIAVPANEQTFVNRQDLLKYTSQPGSPLPQSLLPFLTTYSRDLSAPAFGTSRSLTLANPAPAAEFNPLLAGVRFDAGLTLARPEGGVNVKAGAPVMTRKFPLSKIDLLSQATPDANAVRYYFGLEQTPGGKWQYSAHVNGRIAKLAEVAALGREPNFFEVLQAVIEHGSLARNGGDTYTFDDARASNPYLHILQIGANIIDQWDGDDLPTTLSYYDVGNNNWEDLYGTENLPYINSIDLLGHRPAYDRDRFQLWGIFDLWNPHQNAKTPPAGIDGFRIVPKSGRSYSILFYKPLAAERQLIKSDHVSPKQSIVDLNTNRPFVFSSSADYSEPTIAGDNLPPADANARPGVLFQDFPVGIAVPEYGSRPAQLQADLDDFFHLGDPGQCGVRAHNLLRVESVPGEEIILELQALINGQWKTYQVVDGLIPPDVVITRANNEGTATAPALNTHHSKADADLTNCFYSWRTPRSAVNLTKFDPRTIRFGHNGTGQESAFGTTIRMNSSPYSGTSDMLQSNWRVLFSDTNAITGSRSTAFERRGTDLRRLVPFGFGINAPEGNVGNSVPSRYRDKDDIIRPADGYLGSLATVPGRLSDRPLILNRPFRNVGEIGYVFRDLPWKTMDFFSRQSGDYGLLEAFSCDEPTQDPPIVAGKINLNTRRPEVLQAALLESTKGLEGLSGVPSPGALTAAEAKELAEAIVAESKKTPFFSHGDLVNRVLAPASATDPKGTGTGAWQPKVKTARESAIRSLSGLTTTRTWNLMVDLVVQRGRFTLSAKSGADFIVRAERRYWVHLAIDRVTGEVVDRQLEIVNE